MKIAILKISMLIESFKMSLLVKEGQTVLLRVEKSLKSIVVARGK